MTYKLIKLITFIIIVWSRCLYGQDLTIPSTISYFEVLEKFESQFYPPLNLPSEYYDKPETIEENVFYRWEWFWSNRIDKNGGFAEYGAQIRKVASSLINSGSKKSFSALSWTPLGPTSFPTPACASRARGTGLTQVTSVWANESDLYVGLNGGGLWKRNGTSWNNLTDNTIALSVLDIEVDNFGKIFIATGWDGQGGSLKEDDVYGMGIIYSFDNGASWVANRMTNIPDEDLYMEKVLIDPTNNDIIYALSRNTVYKSIDGGYNWIDTNAPALANNDRYVGMILKDNDPNSIFICSAGQNAALNSDIKGSLFRSTNGGSSWSNSNLVDNLKYSSQDPHWIDLATSANDPDAIYIVYRDFSGYSTLEKSSDNGLNWTTLVDHDDLYTRNYMMHNMAISPTNKDEIFIGGISQYKYDPINYEFDKIASSLHDDLRDYYVFNDGATETIYQGNDAGIYSSIDGGTNWTNLSNGIQGSLFYTIAISDENPNIYLGGVGDCGTHYYNGTSWENMCIGGDGGSCLINEHNTSNMFAMVNNLYYYTQDGGSTWNYTNQRTMGYNKPIIQHPDQDRIYLATANDGWWHKVRVSNDNGTSWSDFSPAYANDRIMAMAISESDPNYFYLTKVLYQETPSGWTQSTSIIRTTDDGASWSDITSGLGTIVNEAKMVDIEIDPENPDKVWVCFGGLSSGEKIYSTSDGGNSWTNISYNLPNLPTSKIEYDYGNQILFLATDIGVYYLKETETIWFRMGDFPHAITTGLELNHSSGKLLASTWGRGLWQTDIEGHCYDGTDLVITNSTTWTSDRELCQNLLVESNLVVKCKVTMPFNALISVKNGATLKIDNGLILNSNILVESGGTLQIINNGSVRLNNDDNLNISSGGIFEYEEGSIYSIVQ